MTRNNKLTKFITKFSLQTVSDEIIHQAKRATLDCIGAMLAGTQTKAAKIATEFANELSPNAKDASVYGMNSKTSIVGAAFANAVLANALDIDDGYRLIKGHPGAFIVPTALMIGKKRNMTGKELLEAVIIGYEIAIRMGLATHQTYKTYHSSGSWGGVGAAAVIARALHFSNTQINHALGIAEYHGVNAPMMRCVDYPSMVKDSIGWGAMSGVSAALLAQKGFTGIPNLLLESKFNHLINSLGKEYKIMDLYFKQYTSCRWGHPAIDGVIQILAKHPTLNKNNVKKIIVKTFQEATAIKHSLPKTTEEAQYSLPYPVAIAFVDGIVGPEQVSPNRLRDSTVIDFAQKVEFIYDPEKQKMFPAKTLAEVDVVMKNGKIYSSEVMSAKGDPDAPLSDQEIKNKFKFITKNVLDEKDMDSIIDIIFHLQNNKTLNTLFRYLQ